MNKLEEWKTQLEQAEEYGLFFDKETVSGMLQTIERYEKALEEINRLSVYYDNKGWALNPNKVEKIVVKALDN